MSKRNTLGGSIAVGALTIVAALSASTGSWSQQPGRGPQTIPQFPPPADFAGVAGSHAEMERIAALCGPNRNSRDGYAPAPAFPGQTKAPVVKGTQGYAVETVAKIERPWGMAFLPNGKILITLRAGGMQTVDKTGTVSPLLTGVPQIYNARLGSGMYGVILDKNFARNRTVYFAYHTRTPADEAAKGRVASAKLAADDKSLTDVKILREGADMQPRAIVQARDGTLMIFSGDVTDTGVNTHNMMSQFGKVLRINTDGSIPKDNPFLSRSDVNPAVWANGFRDPHTAVVHPVTGEVWMAENVPQGGDELDVMRKGKDYGFGVISYGRQNSGAMINGGKTAQEGMEQPLYYWNPSIAPSGMAFYTGGKFPAWKNNLFVTGLSGMQLTRLVMNGEHVVGEEKLLMDRCERFKSVQQGLDGNLYLITDQALPVENEILRIVPAKSIPAPKIPVPGAPPLATSQTGVPGTPGQPGGPPLPRPAAAAPPAPAPSASADPALGQAVFARACSGCHGPEGKGGRGPSIAGRTDVAEITTTVREGAGSMPALGSMLSAADIDAVAKYLGTLPR